MTFIHSFKLVGLGMWGFFVLFRDGFRVWVFFLVGLGILAWFWFGVFFVCFRGLIAFPPVLSPVTSIEYLREALILPRVPMFVTSSENTKVLKLMRKGINTFYFISFRNVAQ